MRSLGSVAVKNLDIGGFSALGRMVCRAYPAAHSLRKEGTGLPNGSTFARGLLPMNVILGAGSVKEIL
jgi:hypothetical protein